MKTHVCFYGLLMLAVLFSAGPALCDCARPDAWEDNDSLETATLVYTFPTDINLNIASDDEDYSSYYLQKNVIINVSVGFDGAQGDINIQLLDGFGGVLVQGSSSYYSDSLSWKATADTMVYLRVYLSSGQCASYSLHVDYDFTYACLDDFYEDNDEPATASQVTGIPAAFVNLVSQYLDPDYFVADVVPGMKLDIQCQFTDSQGDIDLYLLNSDLTVIGSSNASGSNNEQIVWTSTFYGKVYIRIDMFTPEGCNMYNLSIEGCPAPQVHLIMDPCQYYGGSYLLGGTVSHAALDRWTLDYTGGPEHHWIPIAAGNTSIVNDYLGTWDTTFLPPCAYTLRLRAVAACPDGPVENEYMVSFNIGLPGDLDHDGDVDMGDLNMFSSTWLMVYPWDN